MCFIVISYIDELLWRKAGFLDSDVLSVIAGKDTHLKSITRAKTITIVFLQQILKAKGFLCHKDTSTQNKEYHKMVSDSTMIGN